MDGDAVRTIAELAKGDAAYRFDEDPTRKGYFFVMGPGGIAVELVPPRGYSASSLDGFASLIKDLADENARVFVGPHSVSMVLDERTTRSDRASMPLRHAASYGVLAEEAAEGLLQPDFVWLLRSDLAGCVKPETLLPTVRRLKFSRSEAGQAVVEHGSESMGVDVEAAVTGVDGGIPDSVTVLTPVFECLAGTAWPGVDIECALRVNTATKRFTLKPRAGELARAERIAMEAVGNALKAAVAEQKAILHVGCSPS